MMPAQSISGLTYSESIDTPNLVTVTKRLADSHRGPVPVASLAAANTLLAAYDSLGKPATNTSPVYVHRLDKDTLEVSTGVGWRTMTPKASRSPREMDAGSLTMDHAGAGQQGVNINFNFTFSAVPIFTFSVGPSAVNYNRATTGTSATTTGASVFVHASVPRTGLVISWMAVLV